MRNAAMHDAGPNDSTAVAPMDKPLRWLWLAAAVVVLDLGTKALMSSLLTYAQPVEVLPFFNLTLLHNTGAAFSFLAGHPGWQRWLFALVAVGASIGLTLWMRRLKSDERLLAASLALLIGGALGKLSDRIVPASCVDTLCVQIADWY